MIPVRANARAKDHKKKEDARKLGLEKDKTAALARDDKDDDYKESSSDSSDGSDSDKYPEEGPLDSAIGQFTRNPSDRSIAKKPSSIILSQTASTPHEDAITTSPSIPKHISLVAASKMTIERVTSVKEIKSTPKEHLIVDNIRSLRSPKAQNYKETKNDDDNGGRRSKRKRSPTVHERDVSQRIIPEPKDSSNAVVKRRSKFSLDIS